MSNPIGWCDTTWNIVTGCSKISPGCDHCYAERFAKRLAGRAGYDKEEPFRVTFHEDRLALPSHWRKPRRVFVNSMGDLFHEGVSGEHIWRVLDTATRGNRRHVYLILTKRPERMREWFARNQERFWHYKQGPYVSAPWPDPCLWLGVTAEDQQRAEERIPVLLQIPAAKRFVSVEPMLEPVHIEPWLVKTAGFTEVLPRLDWIVAGGENGPGKRPCDPRWIQDMADQCLDAGVPFFDKSAIPIRREIPGEVGV